MKKIIIFITCTFLITITIKTTEAANYLGELCWGIQDEFITKIAFTNMGDNNYLVQITTSESQGAINVGVGNGVIQENKLVMHISDSASVPAFYTASGVLTLDLETKELEYMGLREIHIFGNDFENEFEDIGVLELPLTDCPEQPKVKGKKKDPLEPLFRD